VSDLLVDVQGSTNSQTSTASWVDVTDLVDTQTVSSASVTLLMIATVPITQASGDQTVSFRFAIDGTQEGPELPTFSDSTLEGCGRSLCWATTASAESHAFSIQWISIGGLHATLDTARVRNLQVIEITDSTILVNKTSSASDDAVSGYTDIVGLTDTQTVTSGSVLLLLGNMPHTLTSDLDQMFAMQFEIGGTLEGPEALTRADAADKGCGVSMMWVKSGISGSTTFALQWDEVVASVTADTGRVRSFQVIQITANANKLTDITSVNADTLTTSYTDVVDLVDTVTVAATGSILIFGATAPLLLEDDPAGMFRFYEDNTGEGPEISAYADSAADGCGHAIFWAVTGKSAADHTFSLRGFDVESGAKLSTTYNRSLSILELTVASGITTEYVGPIHQMRSGGYVGARIV